MARPLKVALILQARMGSSRLPGKSLLDLAGAPLVGRILERVKRCAAVDEVVLATADTPDNDPLDALGRAYGVTVFRGSENDLLDRYVQAARAVAADVVLRLPADNCCPEPAEIDKIVRYHVEAGNDFSSNLADVLGNGYPDGIGCEAYRYPVLEALWRDCADPWLREHVNLSFYDYAAGKAVNPDRYRLGTVPCPAEFRRPDIILDVNTRDEYEYMRDLYEYLYPRDPCFHITEVIRWHDTVCTRRRGGSTTQARLIAAAEGA